MSNEAMKKRVTVVLSKSKLQLHCTIAGGNALLWFSAWIARPAYTDLKWVPFKVAELELTTNTQKRVCVHLIGSLIFIFWA